MVTECAGGETSARPRGASWRILLVFVLQGLTTAHLNIRIPDLQVQAGLSKSDLGIVLMGTPLGSLLVFFLASRLVDRFGTRNTTIGTYALLSLSAALTTVWVTGPVLFFMQIMTGAMIVLSSIVINVEADRIEARTGTRIISRCHSAWSVGFFLSALTAGAIRSAGISPSMHLWLLMPVFLVAVAIVVLPLETAPPRVHSQSLPKSRGIAARPTLATAALVAFGVGACLAEMLSSVWATIYIRDTFKVPPIVETSALPAMVLTMAAVRFFADRLIDAYGPRRVGGVAMTIAFAGVSLLVVAPSAAVAMLGFMVCGLGVAVAFPLMMSTAARLGDRPAAENVAATSLMIQMVALVAPLVIGSVAEGFGVRAAYATLLPLLALGIVMSRRLKG